MSIPRLCAAAVLTLWCVGTVRYAAVWENELTLWTWAAQRAPLKPRPALQLTLALLERRQFVAAQAVLDRVGLLINTNHTLPTWDRMDAVKALAHDRLVLARLAGTGPGLR